MTSPLIALADKVDRWSATEGVGVVETAAALTLTDVGDPAAREVLAAAASEGWPCTILDAAGEAVRLDEPAPIPPPYRIILRKPVDGEPQRILTLKGFVQCLEARIESDRWQVAAAKQPFKTGRLAISPWGGGEDFVASQATKSPLDVVREASELRIVADDIRRWLLRTELAPALWSDAAFSAFASVSSPHLVRSLASEVVGSGIVVFNGPPRQRMTLDEAKLAAELGEVGYRSLRSAVSWVYEDPASVEQRHGLFAAEFARSVSRNDDLSGMFRLSGTSILEGSRLAFQLSLSDLSREALKAQADLRKAVADDISKLAENTRSLAASIAVAVATGVGLLAARVTQVVQPWALTVVALAVALYLVFVAVGGWTYLGSQRRLRDQWRTHIYRFIPIDEYNSMVTNPAKDAEQPYNLAAAAALVIAGALVILSVAVWFVAGA